MAGAGRAIWFYLGKLIWPADLVFIYPRCQISQEIWWQYLYPLGVVALFAGLWQARRHSRGPLAGMLLFCGALFPALGFFNVFPFRYSLVADHFQYLASIPIICLACAGLAIAAKRLRFRPGITAAAAILLLAGPLALLTWSQSRNYADPATLYRATFARNPSCWLIHGTLGSLELGNNIEEATVHFREAVRLKPDFAENHYNLGNALQRAGNLEGAVAEYQEALRLKPGLAEAHNNLGYALWGMFRFADALREFRAALTIRPDYLDAHYNLGSTLQGLGRWEEAIAEYREVVRLRPDLAYAHNSLGKALERAGRLEEAVREYEQALKLKPDSGEARRNLSRALVLR